MTRTALALGFAAALLAGTPAGAASYLIDADGGRASVVFRVSHLGFSWTVGRFDRLTGSFEFDESAPAASSVSVEVDATSLNSNHAERDRHLRGADFLDTGKFPKATFVSRSIRLTGEKSAVVTGDLTLRGVTRTIDIEASLVGSGKDPWGGFRQGFTGTASFDVADFGLPSPLARTRVYLQFDIEGIRR